MRVLVVTNMYPTEANPQFGIFVKEQVESLRALGVDIDVLFVNAKEGRWRRKAYLLGFPRLWSALRRQGRRHRRLPRGRRPRPRGRTHGDAGLGHPQRL